MNRPALFAILIASLAAGACHGGRKEQMVVVPTSAAASAPSRPPSPTPASTATPARF